jgi:class 3 adenylate cyclase
VLLIADPTESLPQAAAEVEQLCALLEDLPGVEVTLVGGKNVRKLSLLAAVQEHAVVHFAGHSVYDPKSPGESGWRLHEGLLTARELGKLTQPPQLIFSNSCQAGATAGWESSPQEEDQGFGLGSAFLLAGVPNYIGPCWVVQDGESVEFAMAFYRQAAAGQSLGAALLHARQAGMAKREPEHLTWASYVFYGDPTFTLLSTTHARSLPGGAAAAPSQPVGVLQRKLAAILSADVQGYSRLMGEDEVATIRTLTAYREAMTALIHQHHGRVVDAPGDNLLAEFASAVDAVQGAVEIQKTLKTKNAELPPNRQMAFRIGINVGDVLVEAERLYGDGVNIAARLEALAEGGGICIAGTVYDQVKNKLVLGYEDLGEQVVKNIAEPVRVYRVAVPSPLVGRASALSEPG